MATDNLPAVVTSPAFTAAALAVMGGGIGAVLGFITGALLFYDENDQDTSLALNLVATSVGTLAGSAIGASFAGNQISKLTQQYAAQLPPAPPVNP